MEITAEYQQLLNLLNTGILTKDEFDSKLEILKKKLKIDKESFEKRNYTASGESNEGTSKSWGNKYYYK